MTEARLLPQRVAVACLVLAPLCELVEQLLSPLQGTSTTDDLNAIASHQGVFAVSVLTGLIATLLYVPGFVGLARACLTHSPVAARLGATFAVVAMLGFAGVRMGQALQLEAVKQGADVVSVAGLIDGLAGNPIGGALLVMFLAGTVVGVIALAVSAWRAGLPRPAAVLLALFPFVDLAAKGHVGTIVSHALLLLALSWLALAMTRSRELVPSLSHV